MFEIQYVIRKKLTWKLNLMIL